MMTGKWNGKTCPVCGEGVLHDGSRTFEANYRGERFIGKQPGAYCDKCEDGITYNDPELEARWEQFRLNINERLRAELASIRARLGLTQEQAGRLSGGGHNAFSRYERGEAVPVAAVINLFRLLDSDPQLLTVLDPSLRVPSRNVFALVLDVVHGDLQWSAHGSRQVVQRRGKLELANIRRNRGTS